MNKTIALSAMAFAAAAALQPAFAADSKNAASSSAAASANTSADAGSAARAKPKKYCYIMEPETGSRISVHSCRTKDEWLAVGFDITAKK